MVTGKKHVLVRVIAMAMALHVFVLPLILLVSVIAVKKIQHEILNSPAAALELLEFTEAEYARLQFVEEDEIIVGGHLYDIKSVKKENGRYYIYALADDKEDFLNDINAHNTLKDKYRIKAFTWYYEDIEQTIYQAPLVSENQKENIPSACYIYIPEIPCPPPETV